MRWIFRLLLAVAGLVLLASLMAVGLLLLLVWLLKAGWARLTGQPVQPWVFQFKRQAVWRGFEGFNGFNGAGGFRDPALSARQNPHTDDNVIDVTPKEIK